MVAVFRDVNRIRFRLLVSDDAYEIGTTTESGADSILDQSDSEAGLVIIVTHLFETAKTMLQKNGNGDFLVFVVHEDIVNVHPDHLRVRRFVTGIIP